MENLLQYTFFTNAVLTTILTSICCGLIGTYIVAKRIVFISGGITHASFGGLGIAYYLGINPLIGASAAALLSGLGITFLKDDSRLREDSLIGIFWSVGMAIGIIFIYMTPGYVPNLLSFLFGNILTVTGDMLVYASVLAAITLILFLLLFRPIFYTAFDKNYAETHRFAYRTIEIIMTVLIALTIIVCMKLAGIILVISYLTIPQTIAGIYSKDFKTLLPLSTAICIAGSLAGLYISILTDTPSGATIVITFFIVLLVCKLLSRIRMKYRKI